MVKLCILLEVKKKLHILYELARLVFFTVFHNFPGLESKFKFHNLTRPATRRLLSVPNHASKSAAPLQLNRIAMTMTSYHQDKTNCLTTVLGQIQDFVGVRILVWGNRSRSSNCTEGATGRLSFYPGDVESWGLYSGT